MGIFLGLPPTEVIEDASQTEDLAEQQQAEVVEPEPKPMWGRLIFAVVILVAIFLGGIYCAQDTALADWNKILLHSFELLLGAFIGILTGELASKKTS